MFVNPRTQDTWSRGAGPWSSQEVWRSDTVRRGPDSPQHPFLFVPAALQASTSMSFSPLKRAAPTAAAVKSVAGPKPSKRVGLYLLSVSIELSGSRASSPGQHAAASMAEFWRMAPLHNTFVGFAAHDVDLDNAVCRCISRCVGNDPSSASAFQRHPLHSATTEFDLLL